MIDYIPNYREVANNYLVQQYKESNNVVKTVDSIIAPLQEIEDQLQNLYEKRWINQAVGLQLDKLGEIVGELRVFRKDDEYRIAILIRIMINTGGGTPNDIINAIQILYSPRKVEYKEVYPASFYLFVLFGTNNVKKNSVGTLRIKYLIESIKPSGIGKIKLVTNGGDSVFKFSESTNESVNFLVDLDQENDLNLENLNVKEINSSSEFLVEADTISSIVGSFGFGELILATQNTKGGSTLSEVIKND